MFGDPDVVGERIRFVSVHRRKEEDNRAWTWARVGLDAGIEHYFLKAKNWPIGISVRPWVFEDISPVET